MTQQNTMPKLKPCPFCGAGEYRIEEKRLHTGVYMDGGLPAVIFGEITHWCEKKEGQPQSIMNFKGRDRGDVITIWNTRTPDHTDLLKRTRSILDAYNLNGFHNKIINDIDKVLGDK